MRKVSTLFKLEVTVATYPSTGGRGERPKVHLLMKKTRGSRHQRLFEKKFRKNQKRSANVENKGSGVVYARGKY